MYSKQIVVRNKSGLHARPASDLVKAALKYRSVIEVYKTAAPEKKINIKSLVLLLSLSASCGDELTLCANGPDETEAVDALAALIEAGFGEEE